MPKERERLNGALAAEVTAIEDVAAIVVTTTDKAAQVSAELQETIDEFSRISTLIKQIGRQTKLLALNASIEAAKAGSSGKGFTVVATEVKRVAEQASAAAEQIDLRIAKARETIDLNSAVVDALGAAVARGAAIVGEMVRKSHAEPDSRAP